MKIGIIIVFETNENQIERQFFIDQINQSKSIEFCLVDNDSKDKTLQLLKYIKEVCFSNVSVVEIKKNSSEEVAVRAGARFMFNNYNLKHIGFISVNAINAKNYNLTDLIETVCSNKDFIIDYNVKTIENKAIRPTLFKRVFSVIDYINNLSTNVNIIKSL